MTTKYRTVITTEDYLLVDEVFFVNHHASGCLELVLDWNSIDGILRSRFIPMSKIKEFRLENITCPTSI